MLNFAFLLGWQVRCRYATSALPVSRRLHKSFKILPSSIYQCIMLQFCQYGKKKSDVPAGWDWWYGLVGNSRYYNYTLSVNGTWIDYGDRPEDYLTDRISKFA